MSSHVLPEQFKMKAHVLIETLLHSDPTVQYQLPQEQRMQKLRLTPTNRKGSLAVTYSSSAMMPYRIRIRRSITCLSYKVPNRSVAEEARPTLLRYLPNAEWMMIANRAQHLGVRDWHEYKHCFPHVLPGPWYLSIPTGISILISTCRC
jgi:hypothetical protein